MSHPLPSLGATQALAAAAAEQCIVGYGDQAVSCSKTLHDDKWYSGFQGVPPWEIPCDCNCRGGVTALAGHRDTTYLAPSNEAEAKWYH